MTQTVHMQLAPPSDRNMVYTIVALELTLNLLTTLVFNCCQWSISLMRRYCALSVHCYTNSV